MKVFGPYTGYQLQQELERAPSPVEGVPCARCGETFTPEDAGVYIPTILEEGMAGFYPYHWNCHLRTVFGSAEHIERFQGHPCDATCQDDPALTKRQAADAAVAAYDRMMGIYTHIDGQGMKWRMEGSRPVSQLADAVMEKE